MTTTTEEIVPAEILSLPQVAKTMNLHYQTCYNMVLSGRLPAQMFAGRWFVSAEDVRRLKHERHGRE